MEVSFELISGQIDQAETSGSEAANEPEIFQLHFSMNFFEKPRLKLIVARRNDIILVA